MIKQEQDLNNRTFVAIDLKSFYASVECVERNLDPLSTNLVVADPSRTEKTICLAVSPSLKSYGIPGRARLFEVIQRVKEVNKKRLEENNLKKFKAKSYDDNKLKKDPTLAVSYIVAPPQMAYYMEYSTKIYNIYLKYVSSEDIHVYSVDEVFIDVTKYLNIYKLSAKELAMKMILDVLQTTGITATCGIGSNMYLAKIAMDIFAKKMKEDENGVRIAALDELSYRKYFWTHTPITDFWRVGAGIANRLSEVEIFTMGDIARCSLGKEKDFYNEKLLYKIFGINAKLLIDHAWGYEPCEIKDIKNYTPSSSSISTGQVLSRPYKTDEAKLVALEMADSLSMDLVEKNLVTSQIVLTVVYDAENLKNKSIKKSYKGDLSYDHYGRLIPSHAHGTINLKSKTCLSNLIIDATEKLFDKIINKNLLIRRIYIVANNVITNQEEKETIKFEQLSLFENYDNLEKEEEKEKKQKEKEKITQETLLKIKEKYGKNSIVKGMNLLEGATAMERNKQIGGHKA